MSRASQGAIAKASVNAIAAATRTLKQVRQTSGSMQIMIRIYATTPGFRVFATRAAFSASKSGRRSNRLLVPVRCSRLR